MEILNTELSVIAQKNIDFLAPVYKRPDLNFVAGHSSWLVDDQGKEYLDCCAGIAVNSLGYSHPRLQAVANQALNGLWHLSNLFNNQSAAELAELLVRNSSFASRVHFSLCGASANEGAFKFARKYARTNFSHEKHHILAFNNAFHGRLFGSLAATPRPAYQESFQPLMPGVRFANFNDLASVREQLQDDVCAVIVEPIQGEGGVQLAHPDFLSGLRELCNQKGALLIYDEVQCGLGRTGSFWAWEQFGAVSPDILTTAKPLGNGLPIGAILINEKVAQILSPGDHASTFAGGPFITSVAAEVVRIISKPTFLKHVEQAGEKLKVALSAIKSPHIKAVRGAGLMIGVELSCDSVQLAKLALSEGLIIVPAGASVVRFLPPLIITHEEVQLAGERFAKALARI